MPDDKIAIITGSGQGIGAGCARSLAKAGFKVSLMSPSNRSVELAQELGGIGRSGSVLEPNDLKALVEATFAKFGRIDAVVNNMGHGGGVPEEIKTVNYDPDFDGALLDLPDSLWHESLDMYVLSVVRIARAVTPIMLDQGKGSIVNISSMNALEPRAPYPMSMLRGTLHGFTKLFADRFARKGLRMNNLLPGYCENVNLSDHARSSIPANRPASFDEIGQVCVFLASDTSSYVTGQNILADGGLNRAVR